MGGMARRGVRVLRCPRPADGGDKDRRLVVGLGEQVGGPGPPPGIEGNLAARRNEPFRTFLRVGSQQTDASLGPADMSRLVRLRHDTCSDPETATF